MMEQRLPFATVAPEGFDAMRNLERYVGGSGLERSLLKLVKTRVSQMNGCAYCIDMHTKDARLAGEDEQRLYALPAWRETPFFSERERAALHWAETLTDLSRRGVPTEVYEKVRHVFSDKELVDLTLAVIVINGWNRLAVSFRTPPGSYEPAR